MTACAEALALLIYFSNAATSRLRNKGKHTSCTNMHSKKCKLRMLEIRYVAPFRQPQNSKNNANKACKASRQWYILKPSFSMATLSCTLPCSSVAASGTQQQGSVHAHAENMSAHSFDKARSLVAAVGRRCIMYGVTEPFRGHKTALSSRLGSNKCISTLYQPTTAS